MCKIGIVVRRSSYGGGGGGFTQNSIFITKYMCSHICIEQHARPVFVSAARMTVARARTPKQPATHTPTHLLPFSRSQSFSGSRIAFYARSMHSQTLSTVSICPRCIYRVSACMCLRKTLMRKYWSTETSDLFVCTNFVRSSFSFFFFSSLFSLSLSASSPSSFVCLHKFFFPAPLLLSRLSSVCLDARAISFLRRGSAFSPTPRRCRRRYRGIARAQLPQSRNISKGKLNSILYFVCVKDECNKSTFVRMCYTHINICSIVVLERRRRRSAGSATAAASAENIVKSAAHFRTVTIQFPPPETSCYVRIMLSSNFISFASRPDGSGFGESAVSGWACGSITMPVNNYPNFVADFVADALSTLRWNWSIFSCPRATKRKIHLRVVSFTQRNTKVPQV